mmetsp:Transcript_4315/g.8442  ORF Transcript_4315/g.8442 Transcript_4315/m.8442 type:complete len:87 (+) Transcript_4315:2-262(+)
MQDQLLRDCHTFCLNGANMSWKGSSLSLVDLADETGVQPALSEDSLDLSSSISGGSNRQVLTRLRQLDDILDSIAHRQEVCSWMYD